MRRVNRVGWGLVLLGINAVSVAAPRVMPHIEAGLLPALPLDSRCSVSVSSPVVDYGTQSCWQLEESGAGRLSPGRREITVSIVCPHAQEMVLRADGESTGRGGLRYGEQGATRLLLKEARLDGVAVELKSLNAGGDVTTTGGESVTLKAGQRVAPVVQGRIATGRTLVAQLEIQPFLREDAARVRVRQSSETRLTLTLDDAFLS